MLARGNQEGVRLFWCPDLHLGAGRSWPLSAVAGVPGDQVPADRLHERAVQDAVRVMHRARREPGVRELRVEALQIERRQLRELPIADAGRDADAHNGFVPLV